MKERELYILELRKKLRVAIKAFERIVQIAHEEEDELDETKIAREALEEIGSID